MDKAQRYVIAAMIVCALGRAGFADSTLPPSPEKSPAAAPTDPNGSSPSPQTSTAPSALPTDDSPELMLFKDMPVVVAAGKREQTQREAPASVSVVDANDIDLFGYRSLADILRNQRSFYLHTDGLNWFTGVRGFLRPGEWNSRIMVTVDGRPTNEMIYGQAHLDQDFVVPVEVMKQVEVVRGPGSALYGTNAVFGVINVVTKDGADVNGVQARVQAGTQQAVRGSALYGMAFPDGWDVIASVTGSNTNGESDIKYDGVHDAAHDFGRIHDSDSTGVESAFVKARKGDFTAQFDFENRLRDNRSATYLASFFDPGTMNEQRANIALHYDHEIMPGQSIHAMAFYGHYVYRQHWLYDATDTSPALLYFTQGGDDWLGEEIHYDWQATSRLHVLAGADGRQSLFAHQRDYDTINGTLLNIPSSVNDWGLFVEGEFKATPKIAFTAGARMDKVQRDDLNISPRFAAVYTPNPQDTFKALYGRAFRAPNLYEMLYASPGANVPNPTLKPEIVDTYELVYERQFHSGWRTSLGGYLWKMSDAMENFQFADGALETRNAGTIWTHGLEAEIQRRWENGGSLRAYATYTEAHVADRLLTNSPRWILGTAAVIPVYQRTFLAIEPQIVGPMESDLGQYTDPTFITNVVLTSRDVVKGWDVQAGVYNLFANYARLPRDGAFNQIQPTLDYPHTQLMVSVTHRF